MLYMHPNPRFNDEKGFLVNDIRSSTSLELDKSECDEKRMKNWTLSKHVKLLLLIVENSPSQVLLRMQNFFFVFMICIINWVHNILYRSNEIGCLKSLERRLCRMSAKSINIRGETFQAVKRFSWINLKAIWSNKKLKLMS